jgi:hypothetical protein
MARGTRAREPLLPRYGCGGRIPASSPRGRARAGRRWGTWSGRGPFHALVETGRIGGSACQLGTVTLGKRHTFSEAMVWMTSAGGVPRSSVMMENWLTSACQRPPLPLEWSTYGPFLGTRAFPLASLQRYIQYSRYPLQHRTFATST